MYSIFDSNGQGVTGAMFSTPDGAQQHASAMRDRGDDAEYGQLHVGIICNDHDEHEQGKCRYCAAKLQDEYGPKTETVFTLTLVLGNDAMQDASQVLAAINTSLDHLANHQVKLMPDESSTIWGSNGNSVGEWKVVKKMAES